MATKPIDEKQLALDIAKSLDQAADAIRERSILAYGKGRMTVDEFLDAKAQELELRSEASLIVAKQLSAVIEGAKEADANIQEAIAKATERIKTITSVKQGLKIVAALVVLADALSGGQLGGIVTATKAVIDAIKKAKKK